jgi:hypothetical protein
MLNFTKLLQRHSFHMVDPSIMPLVTSIACLILTNGGVLYFHGFLLGLETTLFGLLLVLFAMFL